MDTNTEKRSRIPGRWSDLVAVAPWMLVGAALASALTWAVVPRGPADGLAKLRQYEQEAAGLAQKLEAREKTLLGYSEYQKYLTASKQALSEQTKLVTAQVRTDEKYMLVLTEKKLGMPSMGAAEVSYTAEYLFGYDLAPDKYQIRASDDGIEVIVGRPVLAASPAVTKLAHRIVSDGWLTDEQQGVIKLQQDASRRTLEQGKRMAQQPAIAALCEKRLTAFLRDFLRKQPGVTAVPNITVVYK
jgi:hypothetical protein